MQHNIELLNGGIGIELILDVLNGCDYNCPGCFINRKNVTTSEQLSSVRSFADMMITGMGAKMELILGSTDIFTATNFDETIEHPDLLAIPTYALSMNSTLLASSDIVTKRMDKIKTFIDSQPNKCEFELFPVLDITKYMSDDKQYINTIRTNLKICDPDVVVFTVNFYAETMFDQYSINTIRVKLAQDFGAELRVVLSSFRSHNPNTIISNAHKFNNMVRNQVCGDIDIVDRYIGPVPFTNFCFNAGEFYMMSYMSDDLPQNTKTYHIPKPYSMEALSVLQQNVFTDQVKYATTTDECGDCKYLMNCTSRNVLTYMADRGISECLLPKELFPLHC